MIGNIETILNIPINSTSVSLVLDKILDFVAKSRTDEKLIIFTPNPEFLVEANKNKEFGEILKKADINIPDGVGLVWAGKFLGKPIKERVSGADLVAKLLEAGNVQRWKVGVVGARRGVLKELEELIKRLERKYPNIVFKSLDGVELNSNFEARNSKQIQNSKLKIQNVSDFGFRISDFDVIFACQGMVKQEKWIRENKDKLNAKVFMGVGGSLDFLTGFSKRAPVFIRQIGLEWLWRGLQKPGHWQRIWRAVFVFSWLVVKERSKTIFNFQ